MSLKKSNRLLIAAALISVGVNVNAFAQQVAESEGISRITDGKARLSARQAGGQGIQQTSSRQVAGSDLPATGGSTMTNTGGNATLVGDCQNGNCQAGGFGQGQCQNGQCQRGCRFNEHYCKHSPDYGYSPPAKYPLHRRGVEYTNYYPAKWYGAGGESMQSQAPMVYQPTDTTQLGFYYQHVPTWLPEPNRVPERPIPAQWHITAPAVQAASFCGPGSNCMGGNSGLLGGHSGMMGGNYGSCDGNCYGMSGRRTVLGSFRNAACRNGYCQNGSCLQGSCGTEWYPADSSPASQGTPQPIPQGSSASTTPAIETVPPYGTAPVPTVPSPAPAVPSPTSAGTAPSPISTTPQPIEPNRSAMMLPSTPRTQSQRSAPFRSPVPTQSAATQSAPIQRVTLAPANQLAPATNGVVQSTFRDQR